MHIIRIIALITSLLMCVILATEQVEVSSKTIEEAARVRIEQSKIIDYASRLLALPDTPPEQRYFSYLILGEYRRPSSIPTLIKYIDAVTPFNEADEGLPDRPAVYALSRFGLNAIPEIIKAYLATDNVEKKKLLQKVILYSRNEKDAIIYIMGLLAEMEDDINKKELKNLIQDLDVK